MCCVIVLGVFMISPSTNKLVKTARAFALRIVKAESGGESYHREINLCSHRGKAKYEKLQKT
jgi:hypothetical protein